MGFIEALVLSLLAHKAAISVDANYASQNTRSNSFYKQIRIRYFSLSEISSTMLHDLFMREPDLVDGQTGPDCQEFLQVKVSRYIYRGQLYFGDSWFTISPKNRFLCNNLIDNLMTNNLRECALVDYSSKLFSPIENVVEHSISIGDYTLFFDHPFFYNLTLMLTKDSDVRFQQGETIQSRAINYPKITIDERKLAQYGISCDETERAGLKLFNASYAVLDDFNSEKKDERQNGAFELRIVDSQTTSSDASQPCSIKELLTKRLQVLKGLMWISIAPGKIMFNGQYLIGTQFNFLDSADGVYIRGCEDRLEIYVCRTHDGWGGIKFRVQNEKDYYRLAAWLVPAVTYYCSVTKGWDSRSVIKEYWPAYRPLSIDN